MALQTLVKIIAPPRQPKGVGTLDQWKQTESELGFEFPPDFKNLIFTYGDGGFAEFLWTYNPFLPDYRNTISMVVSAYRELIKARPRPKSIVYALYPDEGGIFPWGRTDNGDTFYWQFCGSKNLRTILYDGRHSEHEVFDLDCTDFLACILANTLRTKILPRDLEPVFHQ